MSADQPFLGEIYMFAGSFAPQGWAFCNGQLLSIAQFDALFALIGTTYGGDGVNTFALPDLQGRIPIHPGNGHVQGEVEGSENVTLLSGQLPSHTHTLVASQTASSLAGPTGNVTGDSTLAGVRIYAMPSAPAPMNAAAIAPAGNGFSHNNVMPFLVVNFIIALQGIFPSRN